MAQPLSSSLNIRYVLAEVCLPKVAFGLAKTGEIKAQGRDTEVGELLAYAGGARRVAGAGKAVREDSESLRWGVREVDSSGHRGAGTGGERHVHGLHANKDIRASARLRTGVD